METSENEVFIVEESSDEEEDIISEPGPIIMSQNNPSIELSPNDESPPSSIRSSIERARTLLNHAEILSRPNSLEASSHNLSRYDISDNVTASDFYHERELTCLCDVASVLKSRLNAERIYNLGRPQCLQEREIYDELVVTHFADILSSQTTNQASSVDSENTLLSAAHTIGMQQRHGSFSAVSVTNEPSTSSAGLSSEGNQSSATEVSHDSGSTSGSSESSSTTKILEYICSLRRHLEEAPVSVAGNNETFKAVSDFIGELKKSQVFQSIMMQSPSSTPSKKSCKRQRSAIDSSEDDSVTSKVGKKEEGTDDEEESCSICLEPWTSGGDHRICCLKCGHLFGHSCILKWIKQARCCPQCKTPAKKDDIRSIFARKLTVEDTSERDRALKQLEEERSRARDLEHKEALARRRADNSSKLVSALEARLSQFESTVSSSECLSSDRVSGPLAGASSGASACATVSSSSGCSSLSVSQNTGATKKYHHLARINITQDGNCRVFEYSKELGMVVVSTKSTNALFRGFGIKTLSRDFRVLSYQPLHSALIRDMSFRPNTFDGTLLSCGMDKVIQLTSVTSKCVIQKFTLPGCGWCCAWNHCDPNLFYVGMERGLVREFDIRRTDSHVQDVIDLGGAPIASVQFWNGHAECGRSIQGVLIGQIRNRVFREKSDEQFTTHLLPSTQAPLMGISLAPDSSFLTSLRPGAGNSRCQYEVCRLVSGQRVASWEGSSLQAVISRNSLFPMPEIEDRLLAATANHMANTVSVWDVTRGREYQVLNCFDKALDVKPLVSSNQQDLLGALSDSELMLYRWQ